MVKVPAKGKSNNELAKELKTIDINCSSIAEPCLQKEKRLFMPVFLLVFFILFPFLLLAFVDPFLLRWDINKPEEIKGAT